LGEYDDMVQRILDAEVPDDAVTADDIRRAVGRSDRPQTSNNAALVAEEALTVEDVEQDIRDEMDRVPTDNELGSLTRGADAVGDEGRQQAVEQELSSNVATREDYETAVQEAVEASEDAGRTAYKEDVQRGIDSVDKQDLTGSADELTDELARDVGAPAESDVRGEAAQVVANSDSVQVQEVVEGSDSSATIDTVRGSDGQPAAVVGQREAAQQVADELGVDAISPQEAAEAVDVRGTGSTVDVTLNGAKVGEVDV
jgi:hypothetical protein